MVRARFARGRPNIQTAVPTTRPAMRIEAPTRFPAWIAIRANLARIRTAITLRPSAPPRLGCLHQAVPSGIPLREAPRGPLSSWIFKRFLPSNEKTVVLTGTFWYRLYLGSQETQFVGMLCLNWRT